MSDKGGSDLDVFENLSKGPAARKNTLVGLAVPEGPGPALGSSGRGSLPPPPPPSLRSNARPSAPPPAPDFSALDEGLDEADEIEDDEDDVEEVEAVEDASSPMAAPAPTNGSAPYGATPYGSASYGSTQTDGVFAGSAFAGIPVAQVTRDTYEDDATQVFGGFGSQAALGSQATHGSSPLAAPLPPLSAPAAPAGVFDTSGSYGDEEPTPGIPSTADASVEPPTPYMPKSAAFAASAPPPPPPTNRSSLPVPPPPVPSRPLASLPPPPPPTPARFGSSGPPPPVGSASPEWDEDEDKTSIFNRESGFEAAQMLMGNVAPRVGGLPDAPPPMSRPSAPVPSAPVVAMPSPMRLPPRLEAGSVPPRSTGRAPLWLAVAAVVLGAALFFVLRPTTGGLVVTVAGPGSKPIKTVEVLVDGQKACTSSPCSLKELSAGTHMVKARAEGYQETAETAVLVSSGQDAVHNIRLAQAGGTGLHVAGQGTGLRLSVDGKEIGPLPQELKEMAPGEHALVVTSDSYQTWEKRVTVTEDEVMNVDVPKLKVVKGLAVVKAGNNADGARVVLDTDGDRRVLTSLPMTLSIDTSKTTKLTATRKGFEGYEAQVVFEDGVAERTFEVELASPESASAGPATAPRAPRGGGGGAPAPRSEGATGTATLNINSIPASNVLLDGHPVGSTPKIGVSVSAGRHTVVFVLDSKRASKSVNVNAGQTSTVSHRFK